MRPGVPVHDQAMGATHQPHILTRSIRHDPVETFFTDDTDGRGASISDSPGLDGRTTPLPDSGIMRREIREKSRPLIIEPGHRI